MSDVRCVSSWHLILPSLFLTLWAVGGEVYRNDFSTRTSSKPVPPGRWFEMPYAVGSLCNNYSGEYTVGKGYNAADKIQDGWVKAYAGADRSAMTDCSVVEESGNRMAKLISEDQEKADFIIQGFYNSFATGQLKVSIDIRTPDAWGTGNNGTLRFLPLYEKTVNPNWRTSAILFPGSFGPDKQNGKTYAFALSGTAVGEGTKGNKGPAVSAGSWCRYVITHDLDEHRFFGDVIDLSSGKTIHSFDNLPFYRVSGTTEGGIAGFALEALGMGGNAGYFDNIVISWKAPGALEFEEFYTNDFTVRRMRALGNGGVTFAYPVSSAPADGLHVKQAGYRTAERDDVSVSTGNAIVPQSGGNDVPGVVGFDGWRRMNSIGKGCASVIKSGEGGGDVLRMTADKSFVNVMNHVGTRATTGQVRVMADFRTPDAWHWNYRGCGIVLASEWTYTSSVQANCLDECVAWIGVGGSYKGKDYDFRVSESVPGDTPKVAGETSEIVAKASTWYRITAIADVDTQLYSYEIQEIGATGIDIDDVPTGQVIASIQDRPFGKTVSDVSTFVLFAYGPGGNFTQGILADNVRTFYRTDGTEDWKTLYGSTFSVGERLVYDRGLTDFTSGPNRVLPAGDSWITRNFSTGTFAIWSDGGCAQYRSAQTAQGHAYALQPLGARICGGEATVRVDMRPPAFWDWNNGSQMELLVGGDAMFQGNLRGGDEFMNKAAFRMGIGSKRSSRESWTRLYRDHFIMCETGDHVGTRSNVYSESTVDPSHWYRLIARCDQAKHKVTVTVCDMGTSHPAIDAPDGTPVAVFTDLDYVYDDPSGISSIGLAAFGAFGCQPYFKDDPTAALFDNIVVTKSDGTVLFLR